MTPLISHPTLRGDRLVFVAEDDLWLCSPDGGTARRLTSGVGAFRTPRLSWDGARLAASASEEGVRDLVILDADGGPVTRRTWLGTADLRVATFTPDDTSVMVSTAADRPHSQQPHLLAVGVEGGLPQPTGFGPAVGFAFQPGGPGRVLCRHTDDLARWRRYRGGRVGQIWTDTSGEGRWTRLDLPDANVAAPFWWGDRLAFVADHDGVGNLFSARPDGTDLRQHTHHAGFAVRYPACDGARVIYVFGGDLWRIDGLEGRPERLDIATRSQRTQLQVKHPAPARYVERVELHPDGHSVALTVRGRPFVGGHWEGPLVQLGPRQGVRHRLVTWLDADRLICASDEGGDDHLVVHQVSTGLGARVPTADLGRIDGLIPAPDGQVVALVGPHDELRLLELSTGAVRELTRTSAGSPHGVTWSPDGRWLTWAHPVASGQRSAIRLARIDGIEALSITEVTDGRYRDRSPDFDPLGRFLYFLSDRELDPVRDAVFFGYAFPRASRPYLVTLQADQGDPFQPAPRHLGKPRAPKPPDTFGIELEGIADRVVRFQVSEGRYTAVFGLPSGRVLLQRGPLKGTLGFTWGMQAPPEADDELFVWDWDAWELSSVHTKVTDVTLDRPRKTAVIRSGWRLRVVPADPDKSTRGELKRMDGAPGRKSGWIDPSRARLSVEPLAEWRQMLDESWRLMRDNYWEPGLAGVDWAEVRARTLPLVERAACRAELSDLVWCMQGELGTSHAYEIGGDYRPVTTRTVGRLAADLAWDGRAWVVRALAAAEPGDAARTSPLAAAGVGGRVGTRIWAVDGVPTHADVPVGALLLGAANRPVSMEISEGEGPRRSVWVRPLADDTSARLRAWVAANRSRVHEVTGGRAGYVFVPDMGPQGFADFHRDYLAESERGGLVVDVRFNRGGHVSQLLLARLMQRRLAYNVSRANGVRPWPAHSVGGPMVALANEMSGSDGDIFTQQWKTLGLGPVVGTRTWGGVVGIMPRRPLVDRAMTTQPEFANWFADGTGYGVENRGVDPDIEVQVPPGTPGDPQLDRALEILVERLDSADPAPHPSRA